MRIQSRAQRTFIVFQTGSGSPTVEPNRRSRPCRPWKIRSRRPDFPPGACLAGRAWKDRRSRTDFPPIAAGFRGRPLRAPPRYLESAAKSMSASEFAARCTVEMENAAQPKPVAECVGISIPRRTPQRAPRPGPPFKSRRSHDPGHLAGLDPHRGARMPVAGPHQPSPATPETAHEFHHDTSRRGARGQRPRLECCPRGRCRSGRHVPSLSASLVIQESELRRR